MTGSVGTRSTAPRWSRSALFAIFIGACASFGAGALTLWRQELRARGEFDALATSLKGSLHQHLDERVSLLRSARALWTSSREVERDEFHLFARSLLEDRRGALSLEWVERVPDARRAELEQHLSDDLGHPRPFHAPDGARARTADEYRVVIYSHSRDGADERVGLDLALDPVAHTLLEGALAQASALRVADGTPDGRSPEFHAALPICAKGAPSATAQERTTNALGFALGTFSLHSLVVDSLEHMPRGALELVVVERSGGAPRAAFGVLEEDADRLTASRSSVRFSLLDRGLEWDVVCAPGAEWSSARRSATPWVLLFGGLAFTALSAWFLRIGDLRNASLSRANAELYTEVAERHTIERELRETQRALATLVSNLPGVAYRCANDTERTMEFISDGSIPLFGHPPSDFLSGKASLGRDMVQPGDRAELQRVVQHALERRGPFQLEYRDATAGGAQKWVIDQGRGVYSRAGELLAIEGFIADITERKRAEHGLQRERAFIESTIESLPGTFYVFDDAGHLVRWNRNLEAVTGWRANELARMTPLDFFTGDDREPVAAAVREVFENGRATVEARLCTKSGVQLPYRFTGVRFSHDGARYLVGMGLDISGRARTE